jgi:hypothetical protein
MRQTSLFAFLVVALLTTSTQAQVGPPGIEYGNTIQAQVGSPGIEYGNTIAAGDGVQLYPYDQQDTWLHGHFQRVPSYGGFSSFRPYNYRHVFAQTQLAQSWGHTHGMPYSQQFWNRYRGSYLEGNLHAGGQPMIQNPPLPRPTSQLYPAPSNPVQVYPQQPYPTHGYPSQGRADNAYPASAVRPIGYQTQGFTQHRTSEAASGEISNPAERPIHIFPERMHQR